MKNNTRLRFLIEAALIAALYAVLTYVCSLFGLAYGSVQFRISEALTLLPVLTPAAIPGLTLGCVLANLGSVFGPADMLFGGLATLLAAIATRLTRRLRWRRIPWLAPLFPVLFNSLIVGFEISWFLPEGFSWSAFGWSALSVGIGEFVICYALGVPLCLALEKTPLFK